MSPTKKKRNKDDIPFGQFLKIREDDKKTAQNQQTVMSARRPQAYVRRDEIATGTDKAKVLGFKTMREHWAIELTKRHWFDASKGVNMPAGGEPAIARINHGRWDAVCPDPQCKGGEVVDPADPVFMCLSCGNVNNKVNGIARLRPVVFPSARDQALAKKALFIRPRVNRNWTPEKQDHLDLWEENTKHYTELYEGATIPADIAKLLGWIAPEESDGVVGSE